MRPVTSKELMKMLRDSGYDSKAIVQCFERRWPSGHCGITSDSIRIALNELPCKTVECFLKHRLLPVQWQEYQSMTKSAWIEYREEKNHAWLIHDPLGDYSSSGEMYRGDWDGYDKALKEPRQKLNGILLDILCKILSLETQIEQIEYQMQLEVKHDC